MTSLLVETSSNRCKKVVGKCSESFQNGKMCHISPAEHSRIYLYVKILVACSFLKRLRTHLIVFKCDVHDVQLGDKNMKFRNMSRVYNMGTLNGSVMMFGVSERELLSGIKEDAQAKFRVLKIECGYSRTQFTH